MKLSPTVRKHLILFVIVLFAVIILDQVIAILTVPNRPVHQPGPYWNWGAHHFLDSRGLNFPASLNETFQEVWFAETMTFILAPLLLVWLYRRFDLKFWAPWIITGVVVIFAIGANMNRVYSESYNVKPPQFTETLHTGANSPIHKNLNTDYALTSLFPEFLVAQLLFIIPFTLGYLASNRPQQSK